MPATLEAFFKAWRMSFPSVHFLLFSPLAIGGYFLLRGRLRKLWLLLASYYFYFFAAPKYLPVLLCGTLVTWLAGRWIAGKDSPDTRPAPGGARRAKLLAAVGALVLGLAFFKYNTAFALVLQPVFQALGGDYNGGYFTAAGAIGISYYTFAAIGYLIDIYRGDVPAERNLGDFALFLGFFPSVTMGPIPRAGDLLPQLKDTTRRFNPASAAGWLRLVGIGFFKKLAVGDMLAIFTGAIYQSPEALAGHSGPILTLAAVVFALQLYFDFSGYSDIARGVAGLLGVRLPLNFQNPYFSTNFSGFWQRWHMSLSTWLQDYIFTPLVWSRWTEKLPWLGKRVKGPPVLSSLAVVFLVSGIWHGSTWCFVVWGALQALFRIGEELLHRRLGKPKKRVSLPVRVGKTAVVLVLWIESLVFFQVGMLKGGTVADAWGALLRQFRLADIAGMGTQIIAAISPAMLNKSILIAAFLAFTLVCLCLALWADWYQAFRLGHGPLEDAALRLGRGRRMLLYFLVTLCCFAAFLAQSGGFGGGFLYEGF